MSPLHGLPFLFRLVVVTPHLVTGDGTIQETVTFSGGVRSTRGQSIGISIAMLPQTLIMSRLDQLSRFGARI